MRPVWLWGRRAVAIADLNLASGGEALARGSRAVGSRGPCATPVSSATTRGVALRRHVALNTEVFDCRITTFACLAFLAGAVAWTY
jgi:hypothetical protein